MKSLVAVCCLAATAHASEPEEPEEPPKPPRGMHGSFGAGSDLVLTGLQGGSRFRLAGEIDIEPGGAFGRFGMLLAVRAADKDHLGLLCAGVMFEAAASRPRIVLGLHADVGLDLDNTRPLVGGGLRTTVKIWKALGIALDNGAYLVIDTIERTRLVLGGSTSIVIRW